MKITRFPFRFSECHGKSIMLTEGNRLATRGRDLQQCLIFSAYPLAAKELFEVALVTVSPQYAGSVKIGITTFVPSEIPGSAPPNIASIPGDCWYISGSELRGRNKSLNHNFCPSLDWLRCGDRIGLKRTAESGLKIFINSEDMGTAINNLPETIYVVVELFGTCTSVRVTSVRQVQQPSPTVPTVRMQDSVELLLEPIYHDDKKSENDENSEMNSNIYEFHENHGRNIELSSDKRSAKRVASYNQGIVILNKPLKRGSLLEVGISTYLFIPNRITF